MHTQGSLGQVRTGSMHTQGSLGQVHTCSRALSVRYAQVVYTLWLTIKLCGLIIYTLQDSLVRYTRVSIIRVRLSHVSTSAGHVSTSAGHVSTSAGHVSTSAGHVVTHVCGVHCETRMHIY